MELASYVALSQEDKSKLYSQCFTNYQKSHPCTKYQRALELTEEKLSKYFKGIRPAPDRLELCSLQKWYCETREKITKPKENFMEDYFYQKASLLVYSMNTLAEKLSGMKKESADLLRLISSDIFSYINEITSLFGIFVSRMDSKRVKDYQFIEKTYQDMLTDQRIEVSKLEAVNNTRQQDISTMKRSIQNMRSKLTNDYMLINQLRREREFAKEYASIIEEENKKITDTMVLLCEELKVIDANAERFKDYRLTLNENRELASFSKQSLMNDFSGRTNLEPSKKQRYEISKILEDAHGVEDDEFMTAEKSCSTADLIRVTTVSASFAKVKKKDVRHVGVQKTEPKPKTHSVFIQADLIKKSELGEDKSNYKESEDESFRDSAYNRKVIDRFKIENMRLSAPGDRKSLYRQQSLIPDAISELLELDCSYQDDQEIEDVLKVPAEAKVMDPPNKGDKTRRVSRISISNKNDSIRQFKKRNTTVEKNNLSVSPDNKRVSLNFSSAIKKFENKKGLRVEVCNPGSQREISSPQRKLITQKTMGFTKAEGGSSNNSSLNNSIEPSMVPPKSTIGLDYTLPNIENVRENKLRNELIRQKQQFKTLSNRLMICGEDSKRAVDIQTLLGTTTSNIDRLELHLKKFRKSTLGLVERTPKKSSSPSPTPSSEWLI